MIPKSSFVGSQRGRTIDFYKDDNGKYHMIIGLAQGDVNGTAVMMFDRIEGGTKPCGLRGGMEEYSYRIKDVKLLRYILLLVTSIFLITRTVCFIG